MITRRGFVGSALAGAAVQTGGPAITAFTTGGHTVYHLHPARVDRSGTPAIVGACYDGDVLCYTATGRRLWSAPAGGFPFDLSVADIDGDGLDEALVASADGGLYAIDHNGKPLWTFRRTPPLFQVSVAKLSERRSVVLTGGVEQILYALSPEGRLLGKSPTPHCIRHVRAGDIRGEGRDYAAVSIASSGLTGWLGLMLVDPSDLRVLWTKGPLGTYGYDSGKRFFSMLIADVNGDKKPEIVLSNSWGEHGKIFAYDQEGNALWTKSDPRIPNVPYRMNLLRHVKLPDDEFLVGVFANVLIIYNLDGSCREVLSNRYDFANGSFDPASRTFWLGSGVSGGDDVHGLHLDRPGWRKAFQELKPVGKLGRIERNLQILSEQVARFRQPSYQPDPRKAEVLLLDEYDVLPSDALRPKGQYRNVRFVFHEMLSQKIENKEEIWCRHVDGRRKYDLSADQIVAQVREWEAHGRDFVIGSAHSIAIYMPLSTFERVLQAAPKHLWGFELSEMEGLTDQMREAVEQIVFPLADLCRKYGGKKIIFRNKNIFWNGTCYVPFWHRVLLDSKYRDVFVPGLEETNCRTQELSLAGRVGLWLANAFDHWSCRAETDNACFDRMWEWSSQQILSHHMRHLVSQASFGADVYLNSIHQGPFSEALLQQIAPFYQMLEKGVIHVPRRNELLSVSDVCLGMRTPPSEAYVAHGGNGHGYTYPKDEHPAMVFDRLDCYWAGAPLVAHDFSYYAYQVRRRMCNFIPPMPYGLVAIVPDNADVQGKFRSRISTDGQYFYDEGGAQHTAVEYQAKVEQALREAAGRLPLVVRGTVHWSAARIDPAHVRVTLIDPGYLDPEDRDARIVLQHLDAVSCTDILSGEKLPIAGGTVSARVPMGSVRILDIEHKLKEGHT